MPNLYTYLSVHLTVATRQEALDCIDFASHESALTIATVNPEFILEAEQNLPFKKALESMSLCTIDGSGLYIFLNIINRIQKKPLVELVHGADLVEALFKKYQKGEKRFFLLGGPPGLSSSAKRSIMKRYPEIAIVGESDGGIIDKKNPRLSTDLEQQLRQANPDILLVGFGAPKQELWIEDAKSKLQIPVMIGVGGTFGFYTQKKRAPRLLRILHLEWLHRVFTEKGHWRRAFRAVILFSCKSIGWLLIQTLRRSA